MSRPILALALAASAVPLAVPAQAHGYAGAHLFVSTLILDDPNSLFRHAIVEVSAKDETPAFSEKVEDVPANEILPQ